MRESHSLSFTDSQGNTKNTYNDYHLIAKGKPSINPPEIQTEYVEILGRNGLLDMTGGVDGKVYFKNIETTWNFIVDPRFDYYNVFHRLINELHGQKMDIVLNDDDQYAVYTGRLAVSSVTLGEHFNEIIISANIDPNYTRTQDNPESNGDDPQTPVVSEYEFTIDSVLGPNTITIYFAVPVDVDANIENMNFKMVELRTLDGRNVVPDRPYDDYEIRRVRAYTDGRPTLWSSNYSGYDGMVYANRNNLQNGIIKILKI